MPCQERLKSSVARGALNVKDMALWLRQFKVPVIVPQRLWDALPPELQECTLPSQMLPSEPENGRKARV